MQQALPHPNRIPTAAPPPGSASIGDLIKLVSENSVVAFARRGCCMCDVVKLLLNGHGVNPSIHDVDEENVVDVTTKLARIAGTSAAPEFPAVFVGGELVGGLENIMAAHISGELVPMLRKARALWL